MIRAFIRFSDDCGPITDQTWQDIDADEAERFADAVTEAHGGEAALQWDCPLHGWEDLWTCDNCHRPVCSDQLETEERRDRNGGDDLCSDCEADRDDDPHWRGVKSHGAL